MTCPSSANTNNHPIITKVISAAEYESRRYPFRTTISVSNSIVIEIGKWLNEHKIDYDFIGSFSTYEKDANIITKVNFKFSKEEDALAFKLRWE